MLLSDLFTNGPHYGPGINWNETPWNAIASAALVHIADDWVSLSATGLVVCTSESTRLYLEEKKLCLDWLSKIEGPLQREKAVNAATRKAPTPNAVATAVAARLVFLFPHMLWIGRYGHQNEYLFTASAYGQTRDFVVLTQYGRTPDEDDLYKMVVSGPAITEFVRAFDEAPRPAPIEALSKGAIETIGHLFTAGPVWDGNLISKEARKELVGAGLVIRGQSFNWLSGDGFAMATSKETRSWLSRTDAPYPEWREKLRNC